MTTTLLGASSRFVVQRPVRRWWLVVPLVAFLAGCGSSKGAPASPAPLTTVGQQYMAAIGPVDGALTSFRQQALAYTGGRPSAVISAIPATRSTLKQATGRLLAIKAPAPLNTDIQDVVAAANTVDGDLVELGASGNTGVEAQIAKLVGDIGRESAADSAFRFTLQFLTNPASPPSPPTQPAEVTTTSVVATGRTTTTSVAGTTTTKVPSTTIATVARTTTTVRR